MFKTRGFVLVLYIFFIFVYGSSSLKGMLHDQHHGAAGAGAIDCA